MTEYTDDPAFTAQLDELEKRIPYVSKGSILRSGSHEYITGSTMRMLCRVYYDLSTNRQENGDLTVYMSLKEDFREEDEDDEEFQRSYSCDVKYEEVSSLNLPTTEQETTMMLSMALVEFCEMPILKSMYIMLIKRKYGS